jgi:transcriptional regulator with XRE-family HTH domain
MIERMAPIYDEIREAIKASEKSRYRLSQETGISQGQLSEFMAGTKGLSVESLELLAECLEVAITTKRLKRKKGN